MSQPHRSPPITVRWVETNKGDDQCPNIRSRLVAREMRLPGEEAVFAPTPPLETLRMVLSHAVTDFEGEAKKASQHMGVENHKLERS